MKKLLILLILLLFPSLGQACTGTRYWVGGGSSTAWNATANTNWGTASNIRDNAAVPGSGDDVCFDGVGFGASDSNLSSSFNIKSIDFLGYANTLTHASAATLTISGAGTIARWASGMTYTNLGVGVSGGTISFSGTSGTLPFTTAGKTFGNFQRTGAGAVQLQDDLTSNNANILGGTFDFQNKTINLNSSSLAATGSTARTIISSGTININGTGTVVSVSGSNLTLNLTGTINITNTSATAKTFAGGGIGVNFGNVNFPGDNITVTGSNIFNTLGINNAGLTNGLKLTSATTQTATNITSNGSSGSLCKLSSVTSASADTLSVAGGNVIDNYMSIQDSTATGGAKFYAPHSTNVSGNTGWIFNDPLSNQWFASQ